MEKVVFPVPYMNIIQGVNGELSHIGSKAIDLGSKGQKEPVYAPFDGVIKKVYKTSGNFVWFESKEKVLWADGTEDYMTILTGHDDNVESLYVGKEFKQGEEYYRQGSSGNTDKIHVHLEAGRGKFIGNGWNKNKYGVWVVNEPVHPADAFFIKKDTIIDNDSGYSWKRLEETFLKECENPKKELIYETPFIAIEDEGRVSEDILQKIYTCGKDGTYYLKLYKGENLYIENVNNS